MLAKPMLVIAALAALCLHPAVAQEKGTEERTTVEIRLSKEHVPSSLKVGSRADLVMVQSSAKLKKGVVKYRTTPLAIGVEVVKIATDEKQKDPEFAIVAVLRTTKTLAEKIEKAKATKVTVVQSNPVGEIISVQRPVTLRLEALKP